MGKSRYIQTKFWDDNFIVELEPDEKLLFLYLFTNPLADICGGYEISIRKMVYDTGIEKDAVLKTLEKFEKAEKVFYHEGWIYIPNFIKNQILNSKILTGIENSLRNCPDWIKDRVSIQYQTLFIEYKNRIKYSNSNSNSNSNINSNPPNPPVPENSNGNGTGHKNGLGTVSESKFSEEVRRKYVAQSEIIHHDKWLEKSVDGRFDNYVEKWLKNQKPSGGYNGAYKVVDECRFCKKHDLYPDDVKPCLSHQKQQFEDWKKRRDELNATNGSSPLFANLT